MFCFCCFFLFLNRVILNVLCILCIYVIINLFACLLTWHDINGCITTNQDRHVTSCTERSGLSGLCESCDYYPARNKTSLVFSANMSFFFPRAQKLKGSWPITEVSPFQPEMLKVRQSAPATNKFLGTHANQLWRLCLGCFQEHDSVCAVWPFDQKWADFLVSKNKIVYKFVLFVYSQSFCFSAWLSVFVDMFKMQCFALPSVLRERRGKKKQPDALFSTFLFKLLLKIVMH